MRATYLIDGQNHKVGTQVSGNQKPKAIYWSELISHNTDDIIIESNALQEGQLSDRIASTLQLINLTSNSMIATMPIAPEIYSLPRILHRLLDPQG